MGFRNPFRFAVNRENGDIYLADYSPDNPEPNPLRGPAGHGKWTVLREPGNYGWPYCATAELPYVDYDFATGQSGATFDCANPVNESPNNTGRRELPPMTQPDGLVPRHPVARVPGARHGRRRPDGRSRLRLRPARAARGTGGRSTTTACRSSSSGPATT